MDTKYKKLIPVIYLSGSAAVAGLKDAAIVSEDPAALAAQYDNGFTDALMIFDLSDTDREQEAHNDLIREICGRVRIPVFAAGRVRRMEDVKKFLYAGCAMAFLNLAKKENAELAAEVADKFGADKIGACFSDTEQVRENEPLLTGNVSCLLYVGDGPLESLSAITMPVPVIAQISGDMCVKQSLTPAFIHGVTGYGVNKRIGKLQHVRGKLNANGIPVGLHGTHDLLVQEPAGDLGKGTDKRTLPVCPLPDRGLRHGHAPCQSRADRRGLSHGQPLLLLQRGPHRGGQRVL